MAPADEAAVLAFAQKLPVHDLLFLPRNISQPKVLVGLDQGDRARRHHQPAGCEGQQGGGLRHHRARSAVVVAACRRNPHGRVRRRPRPWGRPGTVQETFALALGCGLEKLVVQMTVDQTGAIAIFEGLGFKAEALLRDHVRDTAGKTPRYRGAGPQRGAGAGQTGSLRGSRSRPGLAKPVQERPNLLRSRIRDIAMQQRCCIAQIVVP